MLIGGLELYEILSLDYNLDTLPALCKPYMMRLKGLWAYSGSSLRVEVGLVKKGEYEFMTLK